MAVAREVVDEELGFGALQRAVLCGGRRAGRTVDLRGCEASERCAVQIATQPPRPQALELPGCFAKVCGVRGAHWARHRHAGTLSVPRVGGVGTAV